MSYDITPRNIIQYILTKLKGVLADVALSGSYNDLSNKPTIPTVNNGTLTVKQNGTSKGTFTANQSGNKTIELSDTTYESKAAASGGTDVSLVTTGEKHTWNNKSNLGLGETSSTAYRGDRGKTAYDHSQSDHSGIAPAFTEASSRANIASGETLAVMFGKIKKYFTDLKDLAFIAKDGDSSTKFLRGDGTWQTPTNTKNTAGSTDTSSKIFLIGATSQAANPQTYSDNEVYAQDGVLTSKKTTTKALTALTGSGTAGSDAGSGVSPRYTPSLWTFNSGITVANGEVYLIKIPVAGGTYGVWLSLNNGTNYYPVAVSSGTGRFTTHYAKDTVIAVTYESGGKCSCYAKDGADAVATVTGIFRVLNDYDSGNTNTNVTQTATTTNADYEVLFSATADNTTRTEGARKNSNLKFNPSTGNLQATQLNGVAIGSSPKFTDHTYTAATAAPADIASAGAVGTSANYARQDHTHKIAVATGDANGQVKIAGQNVSVKGLGDRAYDSTAYLPLAGGIMTGQLKTSFKQSVAMGSFVAASNTIPNLCEELRYSSGCCGSCNITTAYSGSPSSVPTGWYNFLWIPHRSGGNNGSADGDNCDYGRLMLFGMNNNNGEFEIKYENKAIGYCRAIISSANIGSQSVNYATSAGTSNAVFNYYSSRPASANVQFGDGKLRHFKATSSMTTGKPDIGDAHIIHMAWDNNNGWDAQLAVGNNPGMMYRRQSNGTWQAWTRVYDTDNLANVLFNDTDIPEGSANLSAAANAHKITTYRNGLMIPYQMDNANDGGMIRCRGTSESNTIFEIATWDDSGSGETIQFNYYPTTSQATPAVSVSVPKRSGTLALGAESANKLTMTQMTSMSFRYELKTRDGQILSDGNVQLSTSSRKFKENIRPLTDDEARKILELETVTFDFKDYKKNCTSRNGYRNIGCIAEDVDKVIPELVTEDEDGEIYGVNYIEIVPYLIKMVQMQQKEIDELKAVVAGLTKEG